GFGLILFLLGNEFFGPNSLFSKKRNNVGEIAGESVSYEEYRQKMEEAENDFIIRTGKNVTENDRTSIQEQAWNELIFKYAYAPEFKKLGVTVTKEELTEMVQGKNIHPTIKQLFTNPQTQQFDKNFVKEFLRNIDKREQRDQALWYSVEKSLSPDRLKTKYFNLLKLSNYVTKEEAKNEYKNQTAKRDAKFLYVSYYTIADSTIKVEDDDLKEYIDKNKDKYKVEEGRSIDYVTFALNPSKSDSAIFSKELTELSNEFKNNDNDSLFVINNSDNPQAPSFKNIGELPEQLKSMANNLTIDSVYGPYNQAGKIVIFKVLSTKNDSVYSARASHILIKPNGDTPEAKAEALKQANSIIAQIKGGAPFEQLARVHGTDGTASRGGDLGWFSQGQMVKKFNDVVFAASNKGLIPQPVETEFGYHIIQVTETKTNKKYELASVEREIVPTEETKDLAYNKAAAFAASVNDTSEFNKALKKDSLTKLSAKNFKKNDKYINSLPNAREIVRWAFTDAKVGTVSQVFTMDNSYIVAIVTGTREEGTASVDDVRDEVKVKVLNEKKAEKILEKLKDGKGSLEEMATKYGTGATSNTAKDVTFATSSVPSMGYEPVAVGKIFGLQKGKRSAPFKGENGVAIVEVISETPAPEIADYNVYKTQLTQQRSGREDYSIDEAIKKHAEVKDNRFRFF
ncbi:MAG TPA: peptidylprolyl isomerase, partial [Cytophagaceae bacterium]